jgi:hypothetical protein
LNRFSVIFVVLFLAALIFASAGSVGASSHEVRIFPFFDGQTRELQAGEVAVIHWGWAAFGHGMTEHFSNRVKIDFTLQGPSTDLSVGNVEARSYWGPVEAHSFTCEGNHPDQGYVRFWDYYFGPLAPGTYTLHYSTAINGTVLDGCDYNGDGKMDPGEGYSTDATITIIQH